MLAFGIITEVDPSKGLARVQFQDHDGIVSKPLPIVVSKTKVDKFSFPFDVNEHVCCLMDDNLEYGVIVGAIYNESELPAITDADKVGVAFGGGLTVSYDRSEKTLKISGTGDVKVDITGNVELKASVKAKVTAPDVEIIAATKVTITSPIVEMSGLLNVAGVVACAGITASAGTGGTGDVAIAGNLNVTGNIETVAGNVKAGTVQLKTHVHGGVQTGAGSTAAPTP
jgi:phage baseplate assembly protein V